MTMDVNGTENINVNALGGADTITVNDLDRHRCEPAIEPRPRSADRRGHGDGAADTVIVNGTNGADNVQITGGGADYAVAGLAAL